MFILMNQMDMKKFVLFFAVLLMGLAVIACTDDGGGKSDYAEALIGTWKAEKVEYYEDGKLDETEYPDGGEYYVIFTETQMILEEGRYTERLRYELKGKDLTFYDEDGDAYSGKIKKLTRKELVLVVVEDPEDDSYAILYGTRVD